MKNIPVFYTEEEAAEILGISKSFLQKSRTKTSNAIEQGNAPEFVKSGKNVRYRREDLITFDDRLNAKKTKRYVEPKSDENNCKAAQNDSWEALNSMLA